MSEPSSAAERVIAAAEAKDRVALLAAAAELTTAGGLPPAVDYRSELLITQRVGALLLSGAGALYAAGIREHLIVTPEGMHSARYLGSFSEERVSPRDAVGLFLLRLYEERYEPFPWRLSAVSSMERSRVRRMDELLGALAKCDGTTLGRTIESFVRDDPRDFSLFGYALYGLARKLSIALAVPPAYDF